MSRPSDWPLAPESNRFVIPHTMVKELSQHPLSKGLYPLGVGYYQRADGHRMSRDDHDDYLLIYCLDGGARLQMNGKKFRISAGDLVLVPKGVPHSYETLKSNPWTIYWAHFDGEDAEHFIAHLQQKRDSQKYPVIRLGVHAQLASAFGSLMESRQSTYDLNAFISASNQLRQILTYIAQLQPLEKQRQSADSFDLDAIHSLMQTRLHEQLELDTLAKQINLSKYHFVKRYKELTGTTPINHFIHLKIERACYLLDVTPKNVNEIAFSLGYEDAYYFSRIFKKIMGVSPSQYRKMRDGSVPYRR